MLATYAQRNIIQGDNDDGIAFGTDRSRAGSEADRVDDLRDLAVGEVGLPGSGPFRCLGPSSVYSDSEEQVRKRNTDSVIFNGDGSVDRLAGPFL